MQTMFYGWCLSDTLNPRQIVPRDGLVVLPTRVEQTSSHYLFPQQQTQVGSLKRAFYSYGRLLYLSCLWRLNSTTPQRRENCTQVKQYKYIKHKMALSAIMNTFVTFYKQIPRWPLVMKRGLWAYEKLLYCPLACDSTDFKLKRLLTQQSLVMRLLIFSPSGRLTSTSFPLKWRILAPYVLEYTKWIYIAITTHLHFKLNLKWINTKVTELITNN